MRSKQKIGLGTDPREVAWSSPKEPVDLAHVLSRAAITPSNMLMNATDTLDANAKQPANAAKMVCTAAK